MNIRKRIFIKLDGFAQNVVVQNLDRPANFFNNFNNKELLHKLL